ncbi:hypothetical protein BBJ28_00016520 [Nothophytophthora sp. Chile5]|nr:hypothetical protein BBJ28_00016520 [Nothophytophthora sp. Chile5]
MGESVEAAGVACCVEEDWAALDSLLGSPLVLDGDGACESPPPPPVSGAATVEVEKRPRKKRRPDRNRPGHEIARLKVQAVEMERRVEKLLASAKGSTQDLLRSCKENRGLKTHLQWSLEHTAAFERILSSQADRALQALPNTLPVSGRNLMYEPIRDDAVFQVLARAVDRQYKETSRVFRVAELQNVTSDVFDAHACRSRKASSRGIDDCILKSRSSRLLPFESHDVENGMRRMLESEAVLLPESVHLSADLVLHLR